MITQRFALRGEDSKRLAITPGVLSRTIRITLDGATLATPTKEELINGLTLTLPDGSSLRIRLNMKSGDIGQRGYLVFHDDTPISRAADPIAAAKHSAGFKAITGILLLTMVAIAFWSILNSKRKSAEFQEVMRNWRPPPELALDWKQRERKILERILGRVTTEQHRYRSERGRYAARCAELQIGLTCGGITRLVIADGLGHRLSPELPVPDRAIVIMRARVLRGTETGWAAIFVTAASEPDGRWGITVACTAFGGGATPESPAVEEGTPGCTENVGHLRAETRQALCDDLRASGYLQDASSLRLTPLAIICRDQN